MASEHIHVVEPSTSFLLKLWVLALLGLITPSVIIGAWPDMSWAGKAERAHRRSIQEEAWQEPWQPIDQEAFSSGWIRCASLEDALALDRKIDDGHLHKGNLVLAEGGVAWIPR